MDCGRAEVYAAEAAAFEGTDLETIRPFDEVADAIERVVSLPWWPGADVRVTRARRDARSSSARSEGDRAVIRLASDQTTMATAAHELAHALAGPAAGHAPVFLAAYLDVIAVITNLDVSDRRRHLHVEQLRRALEDAGLTVGARPWPAPPDSIGAPIAL